MRRPNSKSDYTDDRDRALFHAWRKVMDSRRGPIYWRDAISQAVNMPSPRFWCSEEVATDVVNRLLQGKPMGVKVKTRREMFEEIFCRVVALRLEDCNLTVAEAVFEVVNSPAPKFYLTPKSAYVILQRAKKRCYEERKRRLRHFLLGQR